MSTCNIKVVHDNSKLNEIIESYMKHQSHLTKHLEILEAGCGKNWPIDLSGFNYHLTGIDTDSHALEMRKSVKGDLHTAILGDLRENDLPTNNYDIIYSSFVLEHIKGAENVLKGFLKWLKPEGILILKFPDRDSVYGFFTRITPFWFHIFYKKYFCASQNAGKHGYGPYPTYHDRILSRKQFLKFIEKNKLHVLEEYCFGNPPAPLQFLLNAMWLISLGTLRPKNHNLLYILKKT